MAVKKKPPEPENLERWMVSYADFMTLLFAVFVVLYATAMSKQSEAKSMMQSIAQAFSQSIISNMGGMLVVPGNLSAQMNNEAENSSSEQSSESQTDNRQIVENGGLMMSFMTTQTTSQSTVSEDDTSGSDTNENGQNVADSTTSSGELIAADIRESKQAQHSQDPTGGSDSGRGGFTPGGDADKVADGGLTNNIADHMGEGQRGFPFDAVKKSISDAIAELGENSNIAFEEDAHWLTINISSGMLFAEGSASILSASRPLIAKIAIALTSINNYVRVRGYTDNRFIPNGIFKNSWDLSAARAMSVLNELQNDGLNPRRLAVEAYGEFSPFVSNATAAGRARNRRVVIAISRYAMVRSELPVVEGFGGGTYEEKMDRAGSGQVDIVHSDENGIRLEFRN
ncbi:MAG: OmpA family protein [Succinivibrio sp.]|nr:OmpA family protein [Succinivibrio sp.]